MTDKRDAERSETSQSDPEKKPFTPETLDRSLIALPLLTLIRSEGGAAAAFDVIIDLNMDYPGGQDAAKQTVAEMLGPKRIDRFKSDLTDNYVFARLTGEQIQAFARELDSRWRKDASRLDRPVYRIWLDQKLSMFTNASSSTIKAAAAHNTFGALGEKIVWAVADSGVDRGHPHFVMHTNLDLQKPLRHADFTSPSNPDAGEKSACEDQRGHGTHVAGIIAGELIAEPKVVRKSGRQVSKTVRIRATTRRRNENGDVIAEEIDGITRMAGIAPRTKILSLKVLDHAGNGLSSNLIAAIAYIQRLNDNGRHLRVHGLNMSVGYDFDPEWFACGQSPLCVEVNRLVKSGVSVVVAAGNTGYGWVQLSADTARTAGLDLTINDPGNAELAITVGSTHRDMPHIYGVSYFSSKGPTGDGRLKPDLVAPGEKILSCRSAQAPQEVPGEASRDPPGTEVGHYKEDSGTSMAAPHVSGAVAAFLSSRREFIGRPEEVKEIILQSATDLKRDRHFQGAGLVDLMRALQSV